MTLFGLAIFDSVYYETHVHDTDSDHFHVHEIVTPSFLIVICIGLAVSYAIFSHHLNKYFANELKEEAHRVKIVFILFAFTFLTKAITYLFLSFGVFNHKYTIIEIMNFFWEILPLYLIMRYHNFCFAAQEKYLKEEAEREEKEEEERKKLYEMSINSPTTSKSSSIASSTDWSESDKSSLIITTQERNTLARSVNVREEDKNILTPKEQSPLLSRSQKLTPSASVSKFGQ